MFFSNVTSIDELKTQYKKLAKQHHPDLGGNAETMKAINAEYETTFKTLNAGGKQNLSDGFREVLTKILNLDELNIEICGSWVWVSGDTYAVKAELKQAGFMWANKKKMWYWRPEEAACHHSKGQDMDSIRQKYGSQVLKGQRPQAAYIA